MKTHNNNRLLLSLVAGLAVTLPSPAQETNPPQKTAAVEQTPAKPAATGTRAENAPPPAAVEEKAPGRLPTPAAPVTPSAPAAPAAESAVVPPPPAPAGTNAPVVQITAGEKGLRFNFRNAPLEAVLSYLSEAAGFVIVPETEIRGKVDAWSYQPLTTEEALKLLDNVLSKNGYTAIRNGKTLTIVTKEEGRKRNIPVKTSNNPDEIPNDEELVTQIVPIRYASTAALSRDLQPLLPSNASMTANDSSSALVITDSQANIKRLVKIVRALDTAVANVSHIKVFPLRFADAKELATVVKDLFDSQATSNRSGGGGGGAASDPRAQMFQRFMQGGGGGRGGGGGGPGGGGFGGMPGGLPGVGGGGGGGDTSRRSAPRVSAVADERTNSLVVSAPEEMIPLIEDLVKQIDTMADDITELRVFRLNYADPTETSDTLTQLFAEDQRTSQRGGGFGGGGFNFGNRGGSSSSSTSTRAKKQTQVVALPDPRTSSVLIRASADMMEQIAAVITQLDSNPGKKQKVAVFSLENADAQNVEQILRNMFENNTTSRSRSSTSSQTSNPLSNRMRNSTGSGTGGSTGSSGMGSSRSSRGGSN